MKKSLTIIVPLAMLLALSSLSSVALATDATPTDLNQELNKDIDGNIGGSSPEVKDTDQGLSDDGKLDETELNNTDSRESRSLAAKRGRQPRRGQTASELSEVQKYWGDHKSGKSNDPKDDENPDEDEDPDQTPPGN